MKQISGRAAIFDQPGKPLRRVEIELAGSHADDAIVELEMCTICGSDLHTIHGRRSLHGSAILGHEMIGTVVWLPERQVFSFDAESGGRQELSLGDRVTWCLHVGCGECFYCRENLSQKCDDLFKYGHEPIETEPSADSKPTTELEADNYPTGGFATHCRLRKRTTIVRVPDHLPAEAVTPANCATATVMAAFREAGNCAGKHVLILGAGMLGLTATAVAHAKQAASILVVDPHEARAQRSKQFGATDVCCDLVTAKELVMETTQDRGADFAFDFAGVPDAVQCAIHFVRVGGHAILCGSVMPTESISVSPERIVRGLLKISGVHNYATHDLLDALRFLSSNANEYPFRSLVSKTFSLEDIDSAIACASAEHVRIGVTAK